MTPDHDRFDSILAQWLLATAPPAAPVGLHDAVIARARRRRQRRSWSAVLRRSLAAGASRPATRLAYIVVILALILASTVLLSALSIGARPSAESDETAVRQMVDRFVRPFDYAVPAGIELTPISPWSPALIGWAEGRPFAPAASPTEPNSGLAAPAWATRGIVIASGESAWSHGTNLRIPLREAPSEFVADLRDIGGIRTIGEIIATTLDGRPALTLDIDPAMADAFDIHVNGSMTGLSGDYFLLTPPFRLLVAEIDDLTVLVQIWARTDEDLVAWMPLATQVIDSIDFVQQP